MKFVIYGIVDPREYNIFYVGHTSRFDLRRVQHEEGSDRICGLMIRKITAAGLKPVFVKLQDCSSEREALSAEIFWIDLLRSRGVSLANCQAFEGYQARAEEKARISEELAAGTRMEQLVAIANGRPVREGRRWSFKEDQMMRRMKREGRSPFEIADALNRSVGAIEERLKKAPPRSTASETEPG